MTAPAFIIAGDDKWLGVRLTFVLGALIDAFSVYAMYRLLRVLRRLSKGSLPVSDYAPIAGAAIWALSFSLIQYNQNGLETGLYAALILASTWAYASLRRQQESGMRVAISKWVGFGILLGLMVLARIDGALIVLAYALVDMYGLIVRKEGSIKYVFVYGATALVVSLPWWLYNLTVFGSLMPISGQSESLDRPLLLNLATTSQTFGDILLAFFYTPFIGSAVWFSFVFPVFVILALYVLNKRLQIAKNVLSEYHLSYLSPLFLGGVLQAIYYIFFFSAPHFIARYLHPLRIAWLIVAAASLPIIAYRVRALWSQSRSAAFPLVGVLTIVAIAALYFNVSRYTLAFTTEQFSPAYVFGQWAKQHPTERIGMISSGTAAFVSPNVVNLDGKVNFDALKARRAGTLAKYVVETELDYIADWPDVVNKIANDARPLGATFTAVDTIGPILVLKRTK
jgi:hypothetical protein